MIEPDGGLLFTGTQLASMYMSMFVVCMCGQYI